MKRTIVLSVMLALVLAANARPATPGKLKLAAKDGSTIEARLIGDEYYHVFVTDEGNIVKEKKGTSYYVVTDERFDPVKAQSRRMSAMSARPQRTKSPKSTLGTGAYSKGLVILVSFSDYAFTETNSAFDSLLNQKGYNYNGATGSAKDYFNDASFGQFNPYFDVYGPYTLPQTMSYYGTNHQNGDIDSLRWQMVVDAVALLVADQGDSILVRYDCDGNNYVDNIFIYYAGYAESSGAPSYTIWPHNDTISSQQVSGQTSYAGKTIFEYACSSEFDKTDGNKRTGIGAFCHEFSHVLGLPDLYDCTYAKTNTPATPEHWDVMDMGSYNNNENTPPMYSSEQRFQLGWMTPEVISQEGTYTLHMLNDSVQAYLISATGQHNLEGTNPNPQNYYLLENRQQIGWDEYVPGHGMLIWKIQYSESKWEKKDVNSDASNLGCTIVSAKDPATFTNRESSSADPFPGTENVTSYAPFPQYSLSGITETGNVITFNVSTGTDVEDTEMASGIVMFSVDGETYIVDNLPEGASLKCYDAMGRMLWNAENVGTTYSFSNGREMFLLQVEVNGKVCTLKGI